MRKNLQKVMKAFLKGESAKGDAKNTCSTDGITIYSYDMPIARRVYGGVEIIRRDKAPSNTTRSQISSLVTWLPHYVTVDDVNAQVIVVDQITDTKPHVFKKVYRP